MHAQPSISENERTLRETCILFFFIYKNAKTREQHSMETEQHYQKRFFLFIFFFTLLGIETPKCIQSILYEETKGNYEKCVMSVFEFLRYQKAKKREQQSLQRNKTNVFLSVFSSCYEPKRQNACKGTYMGKRKRILREMCITSVFELLRYDNAKTLVQDSVWINRTTLPKTCILGVFFLYGQVSKRQNVCKSPT